MIRLICWCYACLDVSACEHAGIGKMLVFRDVRQLRFSTAIRISDTTCVFDLWFVRTSRIHRSGLDHARCVVQTNANETLRGLAPAPGALRLDCHPLETHRCVSCHNAYFAVASLSLLL